MKTPILQTLSKMRKIAIFSVILSLISTCQNWSIAQNDTTSVVLRPEKILFQLNKNTYIAGEDIQLEATIFDAESLQASSLSVPLYIDLVYPKTGTVVDRWIFKIKDGQVKHTLKTDAKLASGIYTVRVYTNWARNFFIPQQNLTILNINYEKDISTTKIDTNIRFFDQPIAQTWNRIAFEVKDNFGNPIEEKVWLMSNQKDTLIAIQTNKQGIGTMEFQPSLQDIYQLKLGNKVLPLPSTLASGNTILVDKIPESDLLKIRVQNVKPVRDNLLLLIHQQGKIINQLSVFSPKNSTRIDFNTKDIAPGIINFSLVDANMEVLCQKMYYLEQPSIDSTKKKWLLDTETGSKLSHLSSDDINLQLLTLENKLYKLEKNKHYQYFPQDNIEVKGKLLSNPKVNPKKLSVTMLLESNDIPASFTSGIHFAEMEESGLFTFHHLDFYNQATATISVQNQKESFPFKIDEDYIAPIQIDALEIDWRLFKAPKIQEELKIAQKETFEKLQKVDIEKSTELKEVIVKGKSNTKKYDMNLFSREPTQSIDIQKRFLGQSFMGNYYKQFIGPRAVKYMPTLIIKYFLDGFEISPDMLDQTTLPMGHISRMDIYDGYEASIYGANIVVAFKSRDGSQPVATTSFSEKNKQNKFTVQGYTKSAEIR
ncbi:hypothetical protein [Flectobacillus sp. BAB-3569]|uniref:hypothetical protein n=2 Tax=Flectobacillus sp. BAB-3569 TaxID=1509483 RepID=UPI000BA30904|nr:hypothetical protein [Flectobacillus sp. BAB-3569]PAC33156.1 hypothetical protein BWI92_01185 [Flectobacillus sp. BAB-3569]